MGDKKGRDSGQNRIPVANLVLFDHSMNTVHEMIITPFQTLTNLFVPIQVLLLHLLHTLVVTPHIRTHVTLSEEKLGERHGFFFLPRLVSWRAQRTKGIVSNVHQRAEQHTAELADALLRVQEVDVV